MNGSLAPAAAQRSTPRNKCLQACLVLAFLLLPGCNYQQLGPEDFARQTAVRATELDLHVQQTLIAQQATAQALRLTPQAQQPSVTVSIPTLESASQPAAGESETAQPTAAPTVPPPVQDTPVATQAPIDETALIERMKNANILVYEDMVSRNNTNRYVKDTLTRMGLPFKDDGNAAGWLVNDLNNGAPNGRPWDLVILALEDKVQPQSAYFNYALQALDAGSSVILESWFLNSTYQSGARPFLERCGLEYMGDRKKIPPSNLQLYAMAGDSPLLNLPNTAFSLTRTTNYWWDSTGKVAYDTGDLLKRAPDSTAQLIIGSQADNRSDHTTVAICADARLIYQSFSSHTLTYDTMTLLWENYITNALKARFEEAQ
jgi:hypothetical protein